MKHGEETPKPTTLGPDYKVNGKIARQVRNISGDISKYQGTIRTKTKKEKKLVHFSCDSFRSSDLRVMSPALFP
jgi:hypothetical protein